MPYSSGFAVKLAVSTLPASTGLPHHIPTAAVFWAYHTGIHMRLTDRNMTPDDVVLMWGH